MYTSGQTKIDISSTIRNDALVLTYTVSPAANGQVTLKLPPGLKLKSNDGQVQQNTFIPSQDKTTSFAIEIPLKEKK